MSDKEQQSQDGLSIEPVTIMHNLHAVFPSIAMVAGVQLGIFTVLENGSRNARDMAEGLNVEEAKLAPLLYALVVAGVLQVEGDTFSNTPEANKFLVKGSPEYLGGLVEFHKVLWSMTQSTADSIRTGIPQSKFDFQALPEEELMAYFRKQVHSSVSGGENIARKIDFSRFERLLDAGGGSGGAAMAICRKYPCLKATVADLPKVAHLATTFISEAGMSDRIDVSAVDLCSEAPAGEYDAVLLRAVLQTFPKDDARKILRNIALSMRSGGKIFIVGSILDNSRLSPPSALAYGLVFLNTYENGGTYTEDEHREMLTSSGFAEVSVVYGALSDGMGIVSATKL